MADTEKLLQHFSDAEAECESLLTRDKPLSLPAYDQCMKASHLFNLLDSRGVISVADRQGYIGRVRALARRCCEQWVEAGKIWKESQVNGIDKAKDSMDG